TTASANADAWIDQNSPATNKGGDSILKVQSKGPSDNFRALVRFALPSSVPQGCIVGSATLRLYAASWRTGRTLHALRLASSWSESQVSWGNQPQTAGTAAASPSGQGYLEWNVTTQVQAMYDTGGKHGFLIRDAVENADAEQQFHSREKGESPPQLVIRFAPAATNFARPSTAMSSRRWVQRVRSVLRGIQRVRWGRFRGPALGRRVARAPARLVARRPG
ncbi:MAG TPA: DNRLRE domain-containing protein, partial [Vicinamibacterales bacterium]|nr:DNRLRE domain-containing protein [Vicinamibacterales bacterium]